MNKREFIKTGLLGIIGLVTLPSLVKGNNGLIKSTKKFKLPALPFAYDALEPYMDKETLEHHHSIIHQAYTDKLNNVITEEGLSVLNARNILLNSSKYSRTLVANTSEFLNHRIFWRMLSPNGGGQPGGKIADNIIKEFGSFEKFKDEFTQTALSTSGSGWVWLVNHHGKLRLITTYNHENPFMETLPASKKGFPLICLDISEHSYRSKNQRNKEDYVNSFWKILNWDVVNLRFNKSIS